MDDPEPALRVRMGSVPGASLRIKVPEWDFVRKEGNTIEATVAQFKEAAVVTSGRTKNGEKTNRCVVIEAADEEASIEWRGLYVRGRFRVTDSIWNPRHAAHMFSEFEAS